MNACAYISYENGKQGSNTVAIKIQVCSIYSSTSEQKKLHPQIFESHAVASVGTRPVRQLLINWRLSNLLIIVVVTFGWAHGHGSLFYY